MKKIKLPVQLIIERKIKEDSVTFSLSESRNLIDTAQQNAKNVILSAHSIEKLLGRVISLFLFKKYSTEKSYFDSFIINASWYVFRNKYLTFKNLSKYIDSSFYEDYIKKVVKGIEEVKEYRNQFAHRDIIDSGGKVQLFKDNSTRVELNDDYWDKLEISFNDTWKRLKAIEDRLNSRKVA